MTSYIPDQDEQMVRHYGSYSNASRGLRQKETKDALLPLFGVKELNLTEKMGFDEISTSWPSSSSNFPF
jgi:hypothetical protein